MSTIDNGGPAFPFTEHSPDGSLYSEQPGMTLRDYAAIKAMQALISHHGDVMHIVDGDSRISLHMAAYDHADAMLKARR